MTPKTLAVTGVDGFVGQHLAAAAHRDGWRVIGISYRPRVPASLARHLVSYHTADLRHTWPSEVVPDVVVHLAGLAAVGPSFVEPQKYIEDNSAMVTTMCEALLAAERPVRIVGVSTGAVYDSNAVSPLNEESALAATSPYVVSKLLVEHQLEYYGRRGMDVAVMRPFNHIGPGQAQGFLVPDLTNSINELKPGEPLAVGNLDTERDYTDVRDVARAYLMVAGAPTHAHRVYNVASGVSVAGHTILVEIAQALGRQVPELVVDRSRLRANDPAKVVGSADRLRSEFGWAPTIEFSRSVTEFVRGHTAA